MSEHAKIFRKGTGVHVGHVCAPCEDFSSSQFDSWPQKRKGKKVVYGGIKYCAISYPFWLRTKLYYTKVNMFGMLVGSYD